MKDLIKEIISSSIKNLFNNQPDILTRTSQTTMTEWNLAHHLANEISKYIFWLDNDIEVTKRNHNSHRPDIIFHKRGINELNFLVIELKKHNNTEGDIRKIKKDWMISPLNYRFGASIVIKDTNNWEVALFERGNHSPTHFVHGTFPTHLPFPPITPANQPIVSQIESLVDKILSTKKSNPQAKMSDWEREIDELVYRLYELNSEEIRLIEDERK